MGKHSERTTAKHHKTAKRLGLGFAVGAALVVVAFGATSTLVGAVTTDNSTVHGNRFAKSLRTDGGVYKLTTAPTNGTAFGPGAAAGTVSFAMLPEGATSVELEAGDTISVDVVLPSGVVPTELPEDETAKGYTRAWSATEADGTWTVHHAVTPTATGSVTLPHASFGITTDFTDVRPEEDLTVRASVGLPERYTSTHPTDSTTIPVHWNVLAGVYHLGVKGSGPDSISIHFSSHPEETGERLYLVPGDVVTTTVYLPRGVSPAPLPKADEAGGIASSWMSERVGEGWTVTQTQRVTSPVEVYGVASGTFEASTTNQVWNDGYTVQAEATLPARFTSAQARTETKVPGVVAAPGLGRITAGGGQSIAVSQTNQEGYGWGLNDNGQVGTGSTAQQITAPRNLGRLGNQSFLQVAAGKDHTIALSADKRVYGWGSDYDSQTGTDSAQGHKVLKPTEAVPTQKVTFSQVAAGTRTSLALDGNGRIWGWGSGDSGALGKDVEGLNRFRPAPIVQPAGITFVQVEAGNQTTFAIDTDGRLWGMGSNANGQLGLGTGVQKATTLTQIPMPDNARIVQVAANSSTTNQQTLALTDSGEIIAWGMNAGGEAGIGIDGSQPSSVFAPRKIQTPEGVTFTKLAAGDGVSLGLSSSGQVYSWGIQTLGYETPSQTSVPSLIQLPVVAGGYVDIAAGDAHAFTLGANGQLYGWGLQNQGRLGTTATGFQHTPKLINLALARSAGDEADAVADDASVDAELVEAVDEAVTVDENGQPEAADEEANEQEDSGSDEDPSTPAEGQAAPAAAREESD